MIKKVCIETQKNDVFDITEEVKRIVAESGIQEGTCILYTPHTTASLGITSKMDPAGFEDLKDEINRLIPTRIDFKHMFDTPSDAAGHIKSTLFGVSLTFIVTGGKLLLGGSQGIYFLEFDGPRSRNYLVKVVAD
ncbi:MAG: secondary thiamine-phosphate synthase enzyme YjbQ [Sphaerochaetaceae bacterium]|nr:secondary thiamine-phosphate synthase enzyme YjbQ [Sphaerochaetaceae bacterium]